MSTSPTRRSRLLSAVTAIAIGLAGAVAVTAPAHAAPSIDPAALGSINIHKFEQPTAQGTRPTGTALSAADVSGLTPLDGVTFTAQKVQGVDVTKASDWSLIDTLTPDNVVGNGRTLAPVTADNTKTTAGGGNAAFTGLPVGLYLVTETSVGTNTHIAFTSKPFLVSIPLPVNNTWLYDVHVYPKNTTVEAQKSVDDTAAHVLGDIVTWNVTTSVPVLTEGASYTSFGMTDTLDQRLSVTPGDVTVKVGGTTVPAAHYSATLDAATRVLTVKFVEPTGIAFLDGKAGQSVVYEIPSKVTSLGDGTIRNTASVFVHDPATNQTLTFDTTPVDTKWGAVSITKVDANSSTTVLEGAEFAIYLASDTARATVLTTLTTDGAGKAATTLKAGDYVMIETKAPTGYALDPTPHDFTVTAGSETAATPLTIVNHELPAFMLPLTGGAGGTAFLVGGASLLVLALGVFMRRRARTAVRA